MFVCFFYSNFYILSLKKRNEQIQLLEQTNYNLQQENIKFSNPQQYSIADHDKDKTIVDLNQKILSLEYILQQKQFEKSNSSSKKRTFCDDEDDDENSDMSDNDTDDSSSNNFSKKLKKKHNQPNSLDQYRHAYLKSSAASTHSKHKAVILIFFNVNKFNKLDSKFNFNKENLQENSTKMSNLLKKIYKFSDTHKFEPSL